MSDKFTPRQAFEACLQDGVVQGIVWGPSAKTPTGLIGGPYYQEAPEGSTPDSPYVVFDVKPREKEDTMGDAYSQVYDVEVQLVATGNVIDALSSEFNEPSQSVFAFLDTFEKVPNKFNVRNAECIEWTRTMPVAILAPEDLRSPTGSRVWNALAPYKMVYSCNYPGSLQ